MKRLRHHASHGRSPKVLWLKQVGLFLPFCCIFYVVCHLACAVHLQAENNYDKSSESCPLRLLLCSNPDGKGALTLRKEGNRTVLTNQRGASTMTSSSSANHCLPIESICNSRRRPEGRPILAPCGQVCHPFFADESEGYFGGSDRGRLIAASSTRLRHPSSKTANKDDHLCDPALGRTGPRIYTFPTVVQPSLFAQPKSSALRRLVALFSGTSTFSLRTCVVKKLRLD